MRREGLARQRRRVGLSQEGLAERLGVERSTVARWEAGHSSPHPWHRGRLAEALEIDTAALSDMLDGPDVDNGTPEQFTGFQVLISGSRAQGTDVDLIDSTVPELARVMATIPAITARHGPVGIGIEVVTHLADHFRPAGFTMTPALFGHENVVTGADLMLVIGGATGTSVEVAIAERLGIPMIPFAATGGTAAATYARMLDTATRASDPVMASLASCADAVAYASLVERTINRRSRRIA